jgi:hypothetical protein
LSEKFGSDADRSWYWDEDDIPTTPLGLLRLHGLLFVGGTRSGQERIKKAIIPAELREVVCGLAKSPYAFDDAPPLPEQPEEDPDSIDEAEVKEYLQRILVGDPTQDLAEITELEQFLERYPFSKATEWLYLDVVKNVSSRPRDFHPDAIGILLDRMIEGGKVESRLKAYKLGMAVFGERFAKAAANDISETIRAWAQKNFE